jgi:hypothetical protein
LKAESCVTQDKLLYEFLKHLLQQKEEQLSQLTKEVAIIKKDIRWAVKKFPQFPCRRRIRDKIGHALLLWGAQHVCLQVQQVWTGFGMQCRYCSI